MSWTKAQAVRIANGLTGLRPQIIKGLGPRWASFEVEHSVVVELDNGQLVETRTRVGRDN
jgi:hypothetical protein